MTESVIGYSVEGRPIPVHALLTRSGPRTLVLGGFHGDEPKSVAVARRLIGVLDGLPEGTGNRSVVVVPLVNPDGYERRRRRNSSGVDLNRNFPTADWRRTSPRSRMFGGNEPGSEPETRAIMDAVERFQPALIISIHSISGGRFCNNYDGPGEAAARTMRRYNGYPVRSSIGYPTPGSFGRWAGEERGIPTITLELPSAHSAARCWRDNREALLRVR